MKKTAVLLFALLVSFAAAQNEKGFLDIGQIVQNAKLATLSRYPDANDVMIDDEIVTTYTPDGKSVTWDDTAVKVLTEEGRRDNRVLSFHFNQSYGRATVTLVQTISEDGKVTEHDIAKISATMTDRSQMSSNIYNPNDKILRVNIPSLEINDIVRYVVKRETTKPRVPNTFSDFEVLEYTSPIMRYSYTVNAPSALPLKNRALLSPIEGTVEYTSQATADGVMHKWVALNVPQAHPEPKMPALYTCVQRLLVSTIDTWEDVSKWYWNLCLPHLTTNDEIDAKVKELVAGKATPMEKIRAVFHFVSQEIRYMGETVETEAPGYEPHDVAQTFGKRHGVCRDKAALLAAMLRSAGFQAFPVLINAGPLKDVEVPQPYFNHAVTCVWEDGKYILMDSTDESTAELFPAYLGHKSYLVARPEGEKLQVSDVPDADTNLMRISTHCDIDDDGNLSGYSTMSFGGINDNAYRGFFIQNPEDENRLFIQRMLRRTIPGAVIHRFKLSPEDMRDSDTPLALEISFTAPQVMGGDAKTAFAELPQLNGNLGIVNFIIRDTSLDKRRFPLLTNYKCATEEDLTVCFAPAWGMPFSLPEYRNIQNDCMTWKCDIGFGDGQLSLHTRYAIDTVEFSSQQYSELKESLKTIAANGKMLPIFDRTLAAEAAERRSQPDVVFLDSRENYTLKDEYAWTTTKYVKLQVTSYSGKKDYSELQLTYVPSVEDLRIDYAKVYNGAKCTELNLQENKRMDAAWNASAPRYPKGTTLVANLPSVEIGSVIEYQYTIEHKAKTVPFSLVSSFRTFNPIRSKSISVTCPKNVNLRHLVSQNGKFVKSDDVNITETADEQNDAVTLTWTAQNQPEIKSESNLPRLRYILPCVAANTGSRRNFLADISEAVRDNIAEGPSMQKIVEKMDGMSAIRKVLAVRNMVARDIRTAGPSHFSVPFTALTAAEKTLRDGYGNSLDKAILIYGLLKSAGLKPELVLAKSTRESEEIEKDVTASFYADTFSVPLIRVKADGVTCWLNESTQYAELGTCAYEGHKAIAMDGKVFTITPDAKFLTKTPKETAATLNPDGSARLEVTYTYYGNSFNSMKKQLEEYTPEDRRRFYLSLQNSISPSAKEEGELKTDFSSYPGTVSFAVTVPDFATVQGDLMHVFLPVPGTFAINEDRRTLPFEYKSMHRIQNTLTIALPPEFNTIVYEPGSSRTVLSPNSFLSIKTFRKPELFTFEATATLAPFYAGMDRVPALQEQLRKLDNLSRNMLVIQRTQE
ncbi:MAG: DUF3857 domain-containing protein [Victivallales bacterium]|nr:DUF3857 domain-containing protein [Victivallales bacterium]